MRELDSILSVILGVVEWVIVGTKLNPTNPLALRRGYRVQYDIRSTRLDVTFGLFHMPICPTRLAKPRAKAQRHEQNTGSALPRAVNPPQHRGFIHFVVAQSWVMAGIQWVWVSS